MYINIYLKQIIVLTFKTNSILFYINYEILRVKKTLSFLSKLYKEDKKYK